MALFIAGNQRHWRSRRAVHFQADAAPKFWNVSLKALAQPAVQFRAAGFPQLIPDMKARKINVPLSKMQNGFPATLLYFIAPPALFVCRRTARIDNRSVAGFQGALQFDGHAVASDPAHFAQ